MNNWRVETTDDVCHLIIDKPESSQNVLSSAVLQELHQVIGDIATRRPTGLIIRSAKPSGFIAGADVNEFARVESRQQALEFVAMAHRIFDTIEGFPFPTVALIGGHCLGGGLELALACDYRVCLENPSVRLGLPEVMLGIHPGFGGTVRLIERCGVPAAMDLMLSGRTVVPRVARKMGIIDLAVPERQLFAAAHHLLQKKPAVKRVGGWKRWLNSAPARPLLASYLARQVAKRASRQHYPAPYAVIDLWRNHGGDRQAMLAAEQQSVSDLVLTPASRNLVKVFFLQEHLKSLGRQSGDSAASFQHVHVVGAGVMGGDIASWCALRGLRVSIQDQSTAALARATKRAHDLFRRKMRDPRLVRQAMDRFEPDPDGHGARRADVIIEAIFENPEAKQALFADLEKLARPEAVLASNTSSIPLETIASALSSPDRLVGLHFFNPVAKMQLVEIVRGESTDQQVFQRAVAFAAGINRLPLPVVSSPGFLVNRILMPYLMEAVQLIGEGLSAETIDAAATEFGMPMGPIELADTVGLDICFHVAENLAADEADGPPPLLRQKIDAGKLGRKTGEGFYVWKGGKPVRNKSAEDGSANQDIGDRLVYRYLNETVACLREGIVADAQLADAGLVFGTGFAPFRGGPVNFILECGQGEALGRLEQLRQKHGERFQPDEGWTALDLRTSLQTPSG